MSYNNYALPPSPSENVYEPSTSGLIHYQPITGLPVATQIYYSIGSNATGWTADRTVLSHPGVGADIPVTIGILAGKCTRELGLTSPVS